jgi:Domain of unknown function (DUF5060)/Protein of unknown function (DUF4038)
MGLRFAAGFLALASLAIRAQTPAPSASPCSGIPSYSTCELVFELSDADAAKHSNPYATVELSVNFRSPRQHSYVLPAFWDGGRRIVVRFSPIEAGEWAYLASSNIAAWDGQKGLFTTASSESPGFIRPAALHHWEYSEKANGLDQGHLWMGVSEARLAFLDDAAFHAVVDARASEKFNHVRFPILGQGSDPSLFQGPDVPNVAFFQQLDQRIRYLNQKGCIADLVLARRPGDLLRLFRSPDQRRRFARYVAGRYASMNVTWQAVEEFEGEVDARPLLKEFGTALKQADPYQHPRTAGAHLTSGPLLDDGWMDFVAYGSSNDTVGAVEHQLFPVPFVNMNIGREDSGAGKSGPDDVDAAAFRRRLWNATMDGQYVTYANTGSGAQYSDSPGAKAMTVWYELMSGTRHWELEPFFDADNGRGLALEGVEYLIYIEKPGPLEVTVEKHGYDVLWINPANGESVRKKFSGDHFTGEPPDRAHEWLLHLVRESTVESMNKKYKFESREDGNGDPMSISLQEVEANTPKVPFVIEQPTGDISVSKPIVFSAKLTRETRATRTMMWLWTGEASGQGQGYRVLATSQKATASLPPDLAETLPAVMHLRLYGMNANGKVYEVDAGAGLNQ